MTGRGWLLLLVLVVLVGAGALVWPRLEGTPPEVDAPEELVLGRSGRTVAIELADDGAGLRRVEVRLVHPGGETTLAERSFAGSLSSGGLPGSRSASFEIELDPTALGLDDGDAELIVTARDWSWRDGLAGNPSELSIPVRIDTRAPHVQVDTGLTYVRRGGAGAVVYRLDEETAEDGVRVGAAFFPGVPLSQDAAGQPGRRVALYAIPVDAPESPGLRVVARDAAGNETETSWPVRVVERRFPDSRINLSPRFLESVAVPLAERNDIPTDDPVEAFHRVNTELRARNEARIREILAGPAAERHFAGPFEQLPNSKVTSGFAERRSYTVAGEKVSEAIHYGFDLAATSAAPITASAAGVVRYAGDLGIYGNTVLVDHGLGLTSLYAHLSRVDVEASQRVARGERLGLSGSTGLAGGDHLHFAILVGGAYVDPLEWWDDKWVREHIDAELEGVGPFASR